MMLIRHRELLMLKGVTKSFLDDGLAYFTALSHPILSLSVNDLHTLKFTYSNTGNIFSGKLKSFCII